MTELRHEIACELERTHQNFHHLLDTVPQASYLHPSDVPGWSLGDILYHIARGPFILAIEVNLMLYAPRLLELGFNTPPAKWINDFNGWSSRFKTPPTERFLRKRYDATHAALVRALAKVGDADFSKAIHFPAGVMTDTAQSISIETLFRYATEHFEAHRKQIERVLKS